MANYNSIYTGTQIDEAVGRASVGGAINTEMPNRNLLDNWDFRNPVNQRGQQSYTGVGYTIDRWHADTGGNTVRVNVGSISLVPSVLSQNLSQPIENPQYLSGKSVTLSVLVSGDVNFVLGISTGGGEQYPLYIKHAGAASVVAASTVLPTGVVSMRIYIQPQTMGAVELFAIKLEMGSVSTLANDPPADYGTELAKCQRYYQSCTVPQVPILYSGGYKNTVYFPVSMRATPALTLVPGGGGTISMICSNKDGFHWVVSDGATYLTTYTASADI